MYLWPWLPVNYLPVLSLGNDAPAEESCLRAQCVLRTQSLRAINNWVGLEPCTSWGFGLPDGTDPSRRGLVVQKLNVFHGGNHAVHFSWFSGWFLLQQVISGSSEAIAATEISTASIKLQDEFTLFFFLPKAIYSPALPLNQNIAFVCLMPKHKIRAGSDELYRKGSSKRLFWGICDTTNVQIDLLIRAFISETCLHVKAHQLTSVMWSRVRISSVPLMSKCLWCVLTGLIQCCQLMCVSGRVMELTHWHPVCPPG